MGRAVLKNSPGRTAPSFIAAIAILVLLVAGYLAWGIVFPSPAARSDMVVREFSAKAAAELGPLRRILREEVERYKSDPGALDRVRAAIDDHVAQTRANIESLAEDARDEIEMLEGVGLQTQENRLQRIQQRKADAQVRINGLVAEARGKLPPE